MLLLIIITWTVGIPVTVLAIATTLAWWRDRRVRRAPIETGGPARVYQFMPRSRQII
jgi:hypothetical protein